MQNLTIVKTTTSIQLGHMYEHLFCQRIASFFFEKGVFEFIDYQISGRTYYGGLVVIDIDTYADTAGRYLREITSLSIDLDEDIVQRSFNEIESELQEPLGSRGKPAIIAGLKKLHDQPWQDIDGIDSIDTKDIRRYGAPLYPVEGKYPRTKKLTITLRLDQVFANDNRHLLPLFQRLAHASGTSIQSRVTNTYGIFSKTDYFTATSKKTTFTLMFTTFPEFEADFDEIADIIKDTHMALYKSNGYRRLIDDLQNISYKNNAFSAPNIQYVYEDTLQIVGSKGWQSIATIKNCELLLGNVHIELAYGKQHARY